MRGWCGDAAGCRVTARRGACYLRGVVQPLVRAALAVGVLVLVSGLATERVVRRGRQAPAEVATGASEPIRMPCGPREIPEGTACVPIPRVAPGGSGAAQAAADAPGEVADDVDVALGLRIPRRPDRPADVMTLQLPIRDEARLLEVPGAIAIGSDVDRSVLRLGAPRGAPVVVPALRGQTGDVEVIGIERMTGRGLVVAALATTHGGDGDGEKGAKDGARAKVAAPGAASAQPSAGKARRDAGSGGKGDARAGAGEERWLLLFGSLDGAGPGLARGSRLAAGAVVGFAGDAISPGEPHVRFEARRLRASATPETTPLAQLVGDAESVAVDARNILAPR